MTEKEQIARGVVKRYMWWAAGGALIPIPLADMAVVTGVQYKMLVEISRIYDVPFKEVRVKAILGSLAGFVLQPTLSTGLLGTLLLKTLPGVGTLLGTPAMVLFAGAYAWALGRVFIQHFESGGTFLDFNPASVKQYFQEQFAEGRRMATTMGVGVSRTTSEKRKHPTDVAETTSQDPCQGAA